MFSLGGNLMKKLALVLAAFVLVGAAWAQTAGGLEAAKSTRMEADFTKIVVDMGWGTVDTTRPVLAERMWDYYFFYPVLNKDKVITGYVWWAKDIRIASHYEDILVIINPDGTLQNWWVGANTRHADFYTDLAKKTQGAAIQKFIGMDSKRDWHQATDAVSGSTFSAYKFFGELKTVLHAFKQYVIDANKLIK